MHCIAATLKLYYTRYACYNLYSIHFHLYSTPWTDVQVIVGCLYSYPLLRVYPHFVGFCIILSSYGALVPLYWVYILLCPLRRFLSHFVGFIYYYVLFGGFWSQRVLGCSLVCLASQGWIRDDKNLSAIASPCL